MKQQTLRQLHPSEYECWRGMKRRCDNPNHKSYAFYGGRGISVCERWLKSFSNFLSDMGCKPTLKHSIDRINGNENYEPSNCRWATQSEQNANKRPSIPVKTRSKSGYRGVYRKGNRFKVELGNNGNRVYIGLYKSIIEAALAYNRAAQELFGEFAHLNKIEI